MVRNIRMLVMLYSLLCITAAGVVVCKSSSYDELVCMPEPDSYENPEVECCDYLSDFYQNLPDCSSYFKQYSLASHSQTYTYKCESGDKVQIYGPSPSQIASRDSRMLAYMQCSSSAMTVSLNIYTVIIIQATQYTNPIFLRSRQGNQSSFSTFSQGTYSTLYKYTASASVIMNQATAFEILYLEPGTIKRQCYPNTGLTGTPSITDTSTTTVSIPGATQIGCSIVAYYLPAQDLPFTVSLTSDGATTIWISNAINSSTPMISCASGACSLTTSTISGTPYQIYIKITRASSTLNMTSFTLTYTGTLYTTKLSYSITTRYCFNPVLPHNNKEIDGFYYCPPEAYKCNIMNAENKDHMVLIPKFCTSYIWIDSTFSCTACVENASTVNGICTCNPGFAENHSEGKCLASQYKVEVNLYRVSSTAIFDLAVLIITNPCTQVDNNFFCKESGASNLLYKPIITEFSTKDSLNLSASTYLVEGSYSITINYLRKGGLLRECFNNIVTPGYRASSTTAGFITATNMCIWEGFIKAPESNIELYIKTDDLSYNWVGEYTNILVINLWNTHDVVPVSLVKGKLYYIRIEYYNTGGGRYHWFKWRVIGSTTWIDFTTDDLYYPTRPVWNIFHTNSLSNTLNIVAHDADLGVYYCPFKCLKCSVSLNGVHVCNTCRENMNLINNECICKDGYRWDENTLICEACDDLCKTCGKVNDLVECQACFENASFVGSECACNDGYAVALNRCVIPDCKVSIMLSHNLSTTSILDLSQECTSSALTVCESNTAYKLRFITDFNSLLPSLNLPYTQSYYLNIHSLESGGLLYKDSQSITSKESLSNTISFISSGIVTLTGYISPSQSGFHTISISTTLSYRMFILDDTDKVKLFTSSPFNIHLTSNKFYYIKIEIDSLQGSSFSIIMNKDSISYSPLSNYLYYPIKIIPNPIQLTSCNMSYKLYSVGSDNSIRFCNDICKECTHNITPITSASAPICNSCIQYAELQSQTCNCISDYVYNLESNRCKPPSILRCLFHNSRIECLECELGYKVGCSGDCCVCDDGFYRVVDDPIECIIPIQNCIEYEKMNGVWICAKCDFSFRVDPYGKCLDCDEGFSLVSVNPFTCITEIVGCIIYEHTGLEWICDMCGVSFTVSCEGKCCECDTHGGYIEVGRDPLVCIYSIEHCITYSKYDTTWGCSLCEDSFTVDEYKTCEICNEGFAAIRTNPLLCMAKIEGCSEYLYSEVDYSCAGCEFGFLKCNGKCCECKEGLYMSSKSPDKCIECPNKCKTCKEIEGNVICYSCDYGYIVINGRCECDPIDFYLKGDKCIVKPLEVSTLYQENAIFISFNKPLSTPLTLNDIILTFHDEIDTRLIELSLITLKEGEEYILLVSFRYNIDQAFDISLLFSDKIKDRQGMIMGNGVQYTTLPVVVEGITARNEFCPDMCKECQIVGGRLGCSTCYDFANLSNGECACFVEGGDPKACPIECPENYTLDTEAKTCTACTTCTDEEQTDSSDDSNEDADNQISKTSSSSESTTSSSTASVLALTSALSADKLWSLMNTIQIYTYLPLLQVNMTQSLQVTLKSQDSSNQYFDKLKSYVEVDNKPYKKAYEFRYESAYLIGNIIKPVLLLVSLVLLNILFKVVHRISSGKIHTYSTIVVNIFHWKVYLRFFIQLYLDLLVPCLLQIIYPSQENTVEILVYILNILLAIFLILTPYILMLFTYNNYNKVYTDEEFSQKWGAFYEEFRQGGWGCIAYYIVFFCRRLVLSISLIGLKDLPLIQTLTADMSCLIVLIYVIVYRPFTSKIMNCVQIVNEMCILTAYCLCGVFYFEVILNEELHGWLVLGCLYCSYILHFGVLLYNIVTFIVRTIKNYTQRTRFNRFAKNFFGRKVHQSEVDVSVTEM